MVTALRSMVTAIIHAAITGDGLEMEPRGDYFVWYGNGLMRGQVDGCGVGMVSPW